MPKTVSVCMIVKNEEEYLPRALRNLNGFVDELIVVDTGSSDRTVAIAEEHGARVLHYEWVQPGHKAEARNVGIDAATGDWIVVLDADEIIAQPQELKQLLQQTEADAVYPRFVNYKDDNTISLIWTQCRVFRNGACRYRYREHEVPIFQNGAHKEQTTDLVFEHRAPMERKRPKQSIMLERLLADVAEFPDDPHPRYFLARQYALQDDHAKTLEHAKRYLQIAKPNDYSICDALALIAGAQYSLGDTAKAFETLYLAAIKEPKRRKWWVHLARWYMEVGDYNMAESLLRMALSLWPYPQREYEPEMYGSLVSTLLNQCQARIMEVYHGKHNNQ